MKEMRHFCTISSRQNKSCHFHEISDIVILFIENNDDQGPALTKIAAVHSSEPAPCTDDLSTLLERYPGIVCVNLPEPGTFEIDYDPTVMTRRQLREFAGNLGRTWQNHSARCTVRLQGRACETCAVRLQNRLMEMPEVHHANASFLNGTLSVVFDNRLLSPSQLIERIRHAGAPIETSKRFLSAWSKILRTLDSAKGQAVLVSIAGVCLVTGFASRYWLPDLAVAGFSWVIAYLTAGYSGVRASIRSLRVGVLDIDVLMVLAALGAAFIGAPAEGAVLLFLFALSNLLQANAVGRARRAVAALLDLRPAVALVKLDGNLVPTPIEKVEPNTVIILRPGERVPMDGEILSGFGSINQAAVTGESMPIEKSPGDQVFTGTMNQEGSFEIRVTRPASDSTLARMISLVEAAQGEKATTQRFLEKAEQYYAGGVILFTILLIVVPYFIGSHSFSDAFYRAMAVMVVASPCALILSTPAAILSAIAGLGRRGILVKGGRYLEEAAGIRALALDKTGTLTEGRPRVTDVHALQGTLDDTLLSLAAQAESLSEHPLARAVLDEAKSRNLSIDPPIEFSSITGRGGEATLAGGEVIVFGSLKLMHERNAIRYDELERLVHQLEADGKTVICVAQMLEKNLTGLGILGLQDVLRPDAVAALAAAKRAGIERIAMLTGDSAGVANALARQAGITEVYAGLMPEDKVRVIKKIAGKTPVIMVGDGINDAPALAAAHLGMAMGAAGTDVAMETADVVLMSHDLQQIPAFLVASRQARRVVLQNLVFASAVVVVLVIAALGFRLPLTLGVLGHEGSTVLVCLNGLRLLRVQKSL